MISQLLKLKKLLLLPLVEVVKRWGRKIRANIYYFLAHTLVRMKSVGGEVT